jgi:DNA-directed RNA polymerase specialized sigma24 family protein
MGDGGNPQGEAMDLSRDLAADVQGAWRRFIERTEPLRPALHRYCRSLAGSVWDAEDLVQDIGSRGCATITSVRKRSPRSPAPSECPW